MKYIRTKDEIFTQEKYELAKIFVATIQDEQAKIMPINKTDFSILKQADNLEELCDVYVCVEPNGNHTILPSNSIISIIGTIIYGAIWTDKGLIYVAKINDKGELELL